MGCHGPDLGNIVDGFGQRSDDLLQLEDCYRRACGPAIALFCQRLFQEANPANIAAGPKDELTDHRRLQRRDYGG